MKNIAEILKDCPKGTNLYSTILGEVEYLKYKDDTIWVNRTSIGVSYSFDQFGRYLSIEDSECVLFPSKENRDWRTFQIPFKDGDIIADEHGNIAIYKGTMWYNKKLADYYCGYRKWDNHFISEPKKDGHFGLIKEIRFSTEDEKQKLFDAIKANGYMWNAETNTLEKLVEPKFNVGDVIQDIDTYKVKITEVNTEDECYGYESIITKGIGSIGFSEQDNWKLIQNKFDISTLKPFDKVLVRDNDTQKWTVDLFSFYDTTLVYPFSCVGHYISQCIPYEGNEHLLGTTNNCEEYYKNW